jgi:uncharacterized membrane protein|tara:strand:- start:6458 stop:6946 length:489 start_codon:yes stop_codon:yes gene_type:complete
MLPAAHALAWSVYVGGAVTMELVLRYAQKFMRPSQVAIVCQAAGRTYRWWSLVALLVLMASGIPMALGQPHGFDLTTTFGLLVWMLGGVWLLQVFILALLSFRVHPDMHARMDVSLSKEEMQRERQRVGVAIRRMDQLLRLELAGCIVAVLLGAQLHQLASG